MDEILKCYDDGTIELKTWPRWVWY